MLNSSWVDAPAGFDLVRRVGRGASSVVWQAVQQSTGRSVALKLLDADYSDPAALRRFDRERTTMAALSGHPNVLTVYDAGVQDGRPWIATEYCGRGSLARYVAANRPLDVDTALAVLTTTASALATAHDQGVVHCDVKPANLMLTDFGEPAIGDFGLAQAGASRSTTSRGYTLDYVAPELLDDSKPTPAADVYSLGVSIWELLTGHPPFSGPEPTSPVAVMKRILDTPLPRLPDGTPTELAELLDSMTAKAPDRRPTMSDVAVRARAAGAPTGTPFAAVVPESVPEVVPTQIPAQYQPPEVVPDLPTVRHPGPLAGPGDHGMTQIRHRNAPDLPTPGIAPAVRHGRRPIALVSLVVGSLTLMGASLFLARSALADPAPTPPVAPAAVVVASLSPSPSIVPTTVAPPPPVAVYVRQPAPRRRAAPAPETTQEEVGAPPTTEAVTTTPPTTEPITTTEPVVTCGLPCESIITSPVTTPPTVTSTYRRSSRPEQGAYPS